MRKATAILLLSVFFSMQYGKVISYWHCRIINTVDPSTPCDCEKILSSLPADSPIQSSSATVSKEKNEEVNLFAEKVTLKVSVPATTIIHVSRNASLIPLNHSEAIFQPPRCC